MAITLDKRLIRLGVSYVLNETMSTDRVIVKLYASPYEPGKKKLEVILVRGWTLYPVILTSKTVSINIHLKKRTAIDVVKRAAIFCFGKKEVLPASIRYKELNDAVSEYINTFTTGEDNEPD